MKISPTSSPHNPKHYSRSKYYNREVWRNLIETFAISDIRLKQIHAFSIRHGVRLSNLSMGRQLIYTAVSLSMPMSIAHRIFSQLRDPNAFTWTTIIRGYAESQNPKPAIEIFNKMRAASVPPNAHTFPFLLKAIAKTVSINDGERIHSMVLKWGFDSLVFTQNALLHMYTACGCAESARKLFDLMREKDLVTWNSLINGLSRNGMTNEALSLFREMCVQVQPDSFTMVSVLSTCAELGDLALGKRIHSYMFKVGLDSNLQTSNALIVLYAKCGTIREARHVFDGMNERNVVSWSSLIVGLAANGLAKEALQYFLRLRKSNQCLVPSEITFTGVLHACAHSGMVDEGFFYFKSMVESGIVPKMEHYGCMVDLLGRVGCLKEAYEFILKMPVKPNAVIWRSLLGACAIHGELFLGEIASRELIRFEKHDADYVQLANLYAIKCRWSDVYGVWRTIIKEGVRKIPGLTSS